MWAEAGIHTFHILSSLMFANSALACGARRMEVGAEAGFHMSLASVAFVNAFANHQFFAHLRTLVGLSAMSTMLALGFLLDVEASLTWGVVNAGRIPLVDLSHGTDSASLAMCMVIVLLACFKWSQFTFFC